MKYGLKIVTLGALATAAVVAMPANAAVVTFASYVQAASGTGIRFVRLGTNQGANRVGGPTAAQNAANAASAGGHLFTTTTNNGGTVGARAVDFSFLQPAIQAALGVPSVKAAFTLDLTATAPRTANYDPVSNTLSQGGLTGTFSFIYTGTQTLHVGTATYLTGANLLSGTISPALLTGQAGSTSGGVNGSTGGGSTITYTSDFITFLPGSSFDFALSLTQIAPALSRIDQYHALNSFRAVSTGSFSSDPPPQINGLAVPEPATWGLMVIGFSLLGHQMRRRKVNQALTAL